MSSAKWLPFCLGRDELRRPGVSTTSKVGDVTNSPAMKSSVSLIVPCCPLPWWRYAKSHLLSGFHILLAALDVDLIYSLIVWWMRHKFWIELVHYYNSINDCLWTGFIYFFYWIYCFGQLTFIKLKYTNYDQLMVNQIRYITPRTHQDIQTRASILRSNLSRPQIQHTGDSGRTSTLHSMCLVRITLVCLQYNNQNM